MARLERLGCIAIETLEKSLENGGTRVALAVVRGIGLLDGQISPIGSEDPKRIAKNQEQAAKSEEFFDQFSW